MAFTSLDTPTGTPKPPRVDPAAAGLVGAALLAMGTLAFAAFDQHRRIRRARAWPAGTPSYERRVDGAHARVLVLGDSTGVGVGAPRPELGVAGLLARDEPGFDIVNLSRSGARIADVAEQTAPLLASEARFDLAVLFIGGNDVLRTPQLESVEAPAHALLSDLRKLARRLVWIGPGDVGTTPLMRAPLSLWMSRRSRTAGELFERVARTHGVDFIGFHTPEHTAKFRRHPERFFCDDGIHPSADGYRYCYEALMSLPSVQDAFGTWRTRGAHALSA